MAGLIDKMVVCLNKGVNTVSEGSKIIVEKARLNTQLQEIEREKQNIFQSMGNLIYNLQMNDEIHIRQCEKMCDEIAALNHRILEIQEQMRMYEAARMQGTPYAAFNSAAAADGIQCGQCGFTNSKAAKFCAQCGKLIE